MSALFFPHRVLHAPSLAVAPGGRGARSVKALGWNPKPHWSFLVLDSGHRPLVSAEWDSLTWVRASHWHPPLMSSDRPATLVGRCLQSKTFSAQPSPSACHTTQLCHTSLWGGPGNSWNCCDWHSPSSRLHPFTPIHLPQAPAFLLICRVDRGAGALPNVKLTAFPCHFLVSTPSSWYLPNLWSVSTCLLPLPWYIGPLPGLTWPGKIFPYFISSSF